MLIIFSFFGLFNIIKFYSELAALISRRYKDAIMWRKLEKYLDKFKKIHAALVDIE
jgi:hypothetical protein